MANERASATPTIACAESGPYVVRGLKNVIDELADFVLRRAMARPTITYRQLVDGLQPEGALPALTG